MQIRPARHDDFDALAAITNHYIATTAIHFAYEPVSVDELRATWKPRFPWFVAEDQGVVGYAKAGVWRERAAYQWTCEVGIYVAEAARGRGVGKRLFGELLDECALRGFRSAVSGITLPNDTSVALHQKLGFTHVGTFLDAGWKLGAWHAVDWWQKRFTTGAQGPALTASMSVAPR